MKSFVQITFKRAISFGSLYLIIGIVMSLVISALFSWTSSLAEVDMLFISQLGTLMLPLFAVMGGVGGLMVFVSDRTKGVFEYLIAYGVNVYEIFWSTLLVSFGLVTIVLGISITGNMLFSLLFSGSIPFTMIETLLIYTIPLSYASSAFMCMAGMIWSSLTVGIPGVNSPVGISMILGIGPSLVVMLLGSFFIGSSYFMMLVGGVTLILVALVVVMLVVANKMMNRERLLSDA